MLYVVCLPFEVRKEFIILSLVNDNTSGEKGPQLVRLGIFADSISIFSDRLLWSRNRSRFPVSQNVHRLFSHELVLGWRQEEEGEEEAELW